jgi:hypothetical protein
MRNISHFSWVKLPIYFSPSPYPIGIPAALSVWETLLILQAEKYGKKFFQLASANFRDRVRPRSMHSHRVLNLITVIRKLKRGRHEREISANQ